MGDESDIVISVKGLIKSYGHFEAVRGIDFEVRRGEVLALLGPNGAGKTTTVEILEGFRDRDAGEVSVLGNDPSHRSRDLRAKIGMVLQECAVDPFLTVIEALTQRAHLYPTPRPVGEIIDLVGLDSKGSARIKTLSGGQQRRLDLGLALIGDPELIFLDEPTTGFDPSARRDSWDLVRGLGAEGRTVVLTTHYMDEAQALANSVTVIVGGKVVASGTPDTLGGRDRGETTIRFTLPPGVTADELPSAHDARSRVHHRAVEICLPDATSFLHDLTGWAVARGETLEHLTVKRPSLEDVYLSLTGQVGCDLARVELDDAPDPELDPGAPSDPELDPPDRWPLTVEGSGKTGE